jgi:hypothetical protein
MSIGTGVLRMQGKWEWGEARFSVYQHRDHSRGHTIPRFRNQLRALVVDGSGHVCSVILINRIPFVFNRRSFKHLNISFDRKSVEHNRKLLLRRP